MTGVKICGLRRADDALLAEELGATALGFILAGNSPRANSPRANSIDELKKTLRDFRARSRKPQMKIIGVFVDAPVSTLVRAAAELKLTGVQLHGSETPS